MENKTESTLLDVLNTASGYVWGWPLIILLIGTGIFLSITLRGIQFTTLWHSLYLALVVRKEPDHKEGDISHFQALMTAMAATVGTGNIAGVAVAIVTGGPGALFWMWVTGLVGMATKYGEAVLAIVYREKNEDDEYTGGPMYYIKNGMNNKWLAVTFAVCAAIAAFGTGNMTQSNSVAQLIDKAGILSTQWSGLILAALTLAVIIGGIRSIARVTSFFVPLMIVLYMGAGLFVIFTNLGAFFEFIGTVVTAAFQGQAAAGGLAGAAFAKVVQAGVARGLFSNESGMGSAPIAAAAAKTNHPVNQALVSMTQTFIDTLVVCTVTGFVIIAGGEWTSGVKGAALTANSFDVFLGDGIGSGIVTISLIFFAYSTILGWAYYGEKAVEFLGHGHKVVFTYRFLFGAAVYLGAIYKLDEVFAFSDVMNGIMAVPNLIALLVLHKVIREQTQDYFQKRKSK